MHLNISLLTEIQDELKRLRRKSGLPRAPTDTDLKDAAKALTRLQEVYALDVADLSSGNIMGLKTGAELNAKDTFYLGRFASNQDPVQALKWLEEAVLQVAQAEERAVNATVMMIQCRGCQRPSRLNR